MDLSLYLTKLRTKNNKVFDPVRKKWLVIQPEELVRQTTVLYLLYNLNLPLSRISVEKAILLHNQVRRFDIVYFDRDSHPKVLVECKSPSISLTEQVLEQAVWYNFEIKAPYLLITNGKESHWYRVSPSDRTYVRLSEVPEL